MIFGIGGIGADMRNLMFMKETADKLFGDSYRWSVLAAGKNQMAFCTQAAMLGGNVRVGLEDLLWLWQGATGAQQCRAGFQDPPHHRGTGTSRLRRRRSVRDARPQGRRPGGFLNPANLRRMGLLP